MHPIQSSHGQVAITEGSRMPFAFASLGVKLEVALIATLYASEDIGTWAISARVLSDGHRPLQSDLTGAQRGTGTRRTDASGHERRLTEQWRAVRWPS